MTRSQIFTAAHKLAKTFVGNYSACFALALREVYASAKLPKMDVNEAMKKIQELGFTAELWSKGGITRIYIKFKHNGSRKLGGFIGSDKNEAKAEACGKFTAKYQALLDEISKFEINWLPLATVKKVVTEAQARAKFNQEISINDIEFLIGL